VDEAQRAIIAVRVTKAQEDIATAREDFERGRFRAAVARAYYAMFHVSGAALLTIGVERAKHSGVESASASSSSSQEYLSRSMARFTAVDGAFVKTRNTPTTSNVWAQAA